MGTVHMSISANFHISLLNPMEPIAFIGILNIRSIVLFVIESYSLIRPDHVLIRLIAHPPIDHVVLVDRGPNGTKGIDSSK